MLRQERIESQILSAALGRLQDPPVDLFQVARDIGVGDIRPTEFRNGFTDFSLSPPVIYLSRAESSTRIRFILAHELAHVMLRLPQVVCLIQMRGKAPLLADEEEDLADRMAATILMPDEWIDDLSRKQCTPIRLEFAARLANVSLATLVARAASSRIDVALLHWRRVKRAWHVIERPGAPFSLHGYINPTAAGSSVLDNLGREESDIDVDCQVGGSLLKITGMAYRRGRHAMQFIEPSRYIWVAPESERTHDEAERNAGQDMSEGAFDWIPAWRSPQPWMAIHRAGRHRAPSRASCTSLGIS